MKIKKSQLEILFNFSKGTEGALNLSESRIRDKFIKSLSETTQEFYDQRDEIYKHFCIKDEQGNPALKDGNKYEFPKDILDVINVELSTLGDEEVEIDTPEGIKEILEKSEYKPKLLEAEIIDELLTKI